MYVPLTLIAIVAFPLTPLVSSFALAAQEGPVAVDAKARGLHVLGPGDQISIHALNVEEISKDPVRIASDGHVSLPLVGRIQAAGLTVKELEQELQKRLSSFVREPSVALNLVEMQSQPVSVLGAVNKPGSVQVQGRKTLFEVLSMSEGLRPDAGHSIVITRSLEWGPLPLKDVVNDMERKVSIGKVSVRSIMEAKNPEENILVQPHDVISVPRADMIYVIGDVRKPGGFVLNEHESLSVLQALSLAEGMLSTAASDKVRILRKQETTSARQEIAINMKKIMAGKAKDVPLLPEDILFVPNSAARSAFYRALEGGVQIGTGIAIWRR